MPRWTALMLLGIGLIFLATGVFVGVVAAGEARAEVARLEGLRPLSAGALEDQPAGAEAMVEGVVSPRNLAVFRDFVAYEREEVEVDTDGDGDRRETWSAAGHEKPALLVEAGGLATVAREDYSITQGHALWYDEATLNFDSSTRDGSVRYRGVVAGRPVTAVGTVAEGAEGAELTAAELFGGTREELLASRREGAAFLPIFGGIFGVVGLIIAVVGAWGLVRR